MRLSIAVFLLGIACPAFATDGVLEINQACAASSGCFSGDPAGFPVSIDGTAGRSYRLTSDLVVPDATTSGISVAAPSISLDLNGFEIVRSGCVGSTTNCAPTTGLGSGVDGASATNVSVMRGTIVGMGMSGIRLGAQAEVENVRVRWNRVDGISAGEGSRITSSTAYQNGSTGISVFSGSTILGNIAQQNGQTGIQGLTGSTISRNTVFENSGHGILGVASTISGNTVRQNGFDGIRSVTGEGATISGNTVSGNTLDGIDASAGCLVQRNNVRNNLGIGLNLSADSAYLENVVTGTTTVAGGLDMGGNACNGTASCP